jgi:hypothetical protein
MDACLINISVARRSRASASGVLRIAGTNVVSESGHYNIDIEKIIMVGGSQMFLDRLQTQNCI